MNENNKKHSNQFEINDLIDDAVNNALVRRSEAVLALSDEEANSIAGGTTKLPTIHGVIINPDPTPCPPTILGKVVKPPIILGKLVNPNPPCPPQPIINGIVIKTDWESLA